MSDYDGSIKIDTKIDTKNVSSQMLRLQNQIAKVSQKAADLTEKMRQMENSKIPTEDYKNISDALHKSTVEFDKLLQRQEEMVARGKTSGAAWDSLDRKIEVVGADIRAAQKYQSQMVKEGTAYLDKGAIRASDAYQKLKNQLRDTNSQMQTLTKRQEELVAKENKVSNGADKARRSTGSWLDSFSGKTKRANGLLHNFVTRLRGIALSMFIFNWITKGWNAMLSAIKDGTQNMAKYSTNVNAKMSQLTSAVATLKNAFGALSGPIITAVGPALTMLINMLTAAINKVNQFISALTGKKTWTKATTQVKDYAAGLDIATSSAKKLKGQLQSFNELNVINSNDSGGSGGSGGGGNVSDMFEEVPIDQNIADLAEDIKKAIKSGDWEGLGETIRDELAKTVGKIKWKDVYQKADNFGTDFAEFLNGLFSEDKKGNSVFTSTADVIAGALNTAVFASEGFTNQFEFEQFGKNVAHGFNRFFDRFEWEECAEAINGWTDGFWKFVHGFFDDLSWENIFDGLSRFLKNLTPESLLTILTFSSGSLAGVVSAALTSLLGFTSGKYGTGKGKSFRLNGLGLAAFIATIGFQLTDDNDTDFVKSIVMALAAGGAAFYMSGGNPYFALAGVVVSVGISFGKVFVEHTDDIRNFGKRIKKAFMDKKVGHDETGKETVISLPVSFKTFFNWDETSKLFDEAKKNFKTAFDGKRADFMDIGSYIFEGILDGFTGVLGTVIEPFKDFFTWFGDGICEAFGIHSPAKNMKPYGKYIFLGIIEGWKDKIKSFSFSKYAKELLKKINKGFSNLKDNYVEFKAKVKDEAKEWWKNTKDYWGKKVGSVKDFTTNVKNNASTWWKNTQSWWKSKVGKVKEFTTDVKNQSGTWWKNVKSYWNDKVGEVKKFTTDVKKDGNKWWKNVKSEWSNTTAGKTLNVAIGFAKNALNSAWNSVTSFFSGKSVNVGTKATKKANGGIYSGGVWHDIAHYAVGTQDAPTGQIFLAREAGPELVGTIGNHTSVMNNDQIVASVSDGVARAVRAVIGTKGTPVNVTFKVEGDPNGIFHVTQQKANEYFHSTGKPAFEF
jgi:hypothetical protein